MRLTHTIFGALSAVVMGSMPVVADEAPAIELNTELMEATVRLDGATAEGPKVGTGFIMGRPLPGDAKRAQFVLITANHVLDDFKSHMVVLTTRKLTASGGWERVTVNVPIRTLVSSFRVQDPAKTRIGNGEDLALISGATRYELKPKTDSPLGLRDAIQSLNLGMRAEIREDPTGFLLELSLPDPHVFVPTQILRFAKTGAEALLSERQLWTRHPEADIAVMYVRLPHDVLPTGVLPTTLLAQDDVLKEYGLHPGDELNCLGYPLGAESNVAGFPILRSGKVASYPLLPTKDTKSFLMDFQVFGGNSGGPVYLAQAGTTRFFKGAMRLGVSFQAIVGLVAEEVVLREQRRTLYEKTEREYPLKLARVIHASLISEAIALLPNPTKVP